MAEKYKSNYRDAYILSFMLLSMGGLIAYSLMVVDLFIWAIIVLFVISYQSIYFFKSTYEYNVSIEKKKHLFIKDSTLNQEQKKWFLTKMEEEINKKKKPIFWDQEKALQMYHYLTNKIATEKPLTEQEQYVLNLFLIDYLDLDQIARSWIKVVNQN